MNDRWHDVRSALRETADRFVELVRTARDPQAGVVPGWGIADTAAHLVVVCSFDAYCVTDGDVPFVAPEALALVPAANLDSLSQVNVVAGRHFTERRLDVLADDIAARVDVLLERTADHDPDALWPWLGGARLPTTFLLSHALNEMLVHGHDIARAEGRSWPIPPRIAAIAFDQFILTLLRGDSGGFFMAPSTAALNRVRVRVRIPFNRPVTLVADRGRLFVDDADGPVDLHLWARPTTMLFVLWRRAGVVRSVFSGGLRVWGRRPWLATRFLAAARTP